MEDERAWWLRHDLCQCGFCLIWHQNYLWKLFLKCSFHALSRQKRRQAMDIGYIFKKNLAIHGLFHSFFYFRYFLQFDDKWEDSQCEMIGRFLEVLGNKFYYKSSPNDWWLFGQLWKPLLFKSNWRGYFLTTFGKTWATFYSTSGHTVNTRIN